MSVVKGLQTFYDLRVLRGDVFGLANVRHRVVQLNRIRRWFPIGVIAILASMGLTGLTHRQPRFVMR